MVILKYEKIYRHHRRKKNNIIHFIFSLFSGSANVDVERGNSDFSEYSIFKLINSSIHTELNRRRRRVRQCKMVVVVGHGEKYWAGRRCWTRCFTFVAISAISINGRQWAIQDGVMRIFCRISGNQRTSEIPTWPKTSVSMALVIVVIAFSLLFHCIRL